MTLVNWINTLEEDVSFVDEENGSPGDSVVKDSFQTIFQLRGVGANVTTCYSKDSSS